jgi:polyisoprenoid-binding protein YceI
VTWKRWVIAGVLGAAVVGVGGPYLYIHVIEGKAPERLRISSTGSSSSTAPATYDGTWKVTGGSQVGYRVKEVLFGQNNEAVGRTNDVSGTLAVDGTTIRSADFTVDMTTVASDQARRDNQFRGRVMNVATYPTATLTLTEPVDVGPAPAEGVQRTYAARGKLTLRGTTKEISLKLTGVRDGALIKVSGSIPITFADWNIPSPSFGPVTTEDHGDLEFALNFARA